VRVSTRLAIGSAAALFVFAVVSCNAPVRTDGGPGLAASAHPGAAIYARQCQSCHGPRGRGDGPAARKANMDVPDLTDGETAGQSDQDLFDIVTKGSKPMPSFRDRLGEQQRWDVVRYVRAAFAPAGGKP
jgi:mono/diheme cytochrome c family protein